MSGIAVKKVKVTDTRVRFTEPVQYVEVGPANSNYIRYNAPSANSNVTSVFNIVAPSGSVGMSKHAYLHVKGTMTITGTGFNQANHWMDGSTTASAICLRPFALQQCITSENFQINNQTFTTNPYLYLDPLIRTNLKTESMVEHLSGTATTVDRFTDQLSVLEGIGSPYAPESYIPSGDGVLQGRTAQITSMVYAGDSSVIVGFDITEPLLTSPFTLAKYESRSIYDIQNMIITLNWASDFWRFFSFNFPPYSATAALNPTITGVAASFTEQWIEIGWVTPQPYDIVPVDRPLLTNYMNVQIFQSNTQAAPAVSGGASASISGIVAQLSYVPKYILCFARMSETDRYAKTVTIGGNTTGISYADWYYAPQNSNSSPLSIQFNNKSGLLSSATPHQLYQICIRNGLSQQSFREWLGAQFYTSGGFSNTKNSATQYGSGYTNGNGPIYIFDPAKDLGLSETQSDGCMTNVSFQVTNYNYINQSQYPVSGVVLYYLVLTEGVLAIDRTSATLSIGNITEADVLALAEDVGVSSEDVARERSRQGVFGGSYIRHMGNMDHKKSGGFGLGGEAGGFIEGGSSVSRSSVKKQLASRYA